jgi:hypothetical protein
VHEDPEVGQDDDDTVQPDLTQPLISSSRKMSPTTRKSSMIHRARRKTHIVVQNPFSSG